LVGFADLHFAPHVPGKPSFCMDAVPGGSTATNKLSGKPIGTHSTCCYQEHSNEKITLKE